MTEVYQYDGESRVNEYKQTVDARESYPMTTSYIYDTLDRVEEAHYPAQYGLSGNPRKIVAHTYDTASRLTQMIYDGAVQASDMMINAADQTTEIKIGEAGTNQVTEQYTFDPQTGLLTNQTAKKNGTTTLLNLSYEYNRLGSAGNLNGKTGHLTKIIDHSNTAKNREYEFDAVGRLTKAKGGATGTLWDQTYSYDRYGNRTNVTANGVAADSSPIPLDGIPNLAYDATSNRITTTGFQYDSAGNQTSGFSADGTPLNFEYDTANRVQIIKRQSDSGLVQAFQYGSTNARLIDYDANTGQNKFYASTGGTVLAEYIEFAQFVFTWTKSYTYLGSSQLATVTPNGTGGEYTEFNHPDRLGTKVITNQPGGTSYEQTTLPFGTALNAESTGSTNKRFTSYDRSNATGLDYAINRTYDSKLGRFIQVDPIGMQAVDLNIPQTLNLYTYCGNDPVNRVDPNGLFWGFFKKLFKWIGKHLKKIFAAVAVALAVVALVVFPWSAPVTLKAIFGLVAALASAASSVFDLAGLKTLSKVFGIIAMAAGIAALGFEIKNAWDKLKNAGPKIFSFADDPITIYAEVTVKISFWDTVTSTISSVSNQISVGVGLSGALSAGSGVNRGGSHAVSDDFYKGCMAMVVKKYGSKVANALKRHIAAQGALGAQVLTDPKVAGPYAVAAVGARMGQPVAVLGGLVAGTVNATKMEGAMSAGFNLVDRTLGGALEAIMDSGDCSRLAR